MGLSREEIQKKLTARYSSEDQKTLKEISYNLAVAGTTENNLEIRAAQALKRLKGAAPSAAAEALHHASKMTAHNMLSICPICKVGMSPVKIMDDREVYYCAQHRIIQPLPIDQDLDLAIDPRGD
jgi:hypothetical protein